MSVNCRWTEEDDAALKQQVESGITHNKLHVPPHTVASTRQRYKQLGLKCTAKAGNGLVGYEHPETPTAARSPMAEDLYWAAGFYEGEGSAIYAGQSTQATVSQKTVEPLLRMQELFGGGIYQRARGIYVWHVSGSRARGFLMTMLPLLSERRFDQAVRALH